MKSPEYIAEAKAYLSSMSEHDLEDSGDEFQRLFGYAMELSIALTAAQQYGQLKASQLTDATTELLAARASATASAERIKDLETTIAHMSREGHL